MIWYFCLFVQRPPASSSLVGWLVSTPLLDQTFLICLSCPLFIVLLWRRFVWYRTGYRAAGKNGWRTRGERSLQGSQTSGAYTPWYKGGWVRSALLFEHSRLAPASSFCSFMSWRCTSPVLRSCSWSFIRCSTPCFRLDSSACSPNGNIRPRKRGIGGCASWATKEERNVRGWESRCHHRSACLRVSVYRFPGLSVDPASALL